MYLIAIAWIYVALMMAAAEAAHPTGTLLGALLTLLLYGVLPVGLVMYLLGGKYRRQARERQAATIEAPRAAPVAPPDPIQVSAAAQPDGHSHSAGDPIAPVGKKA